MQHSYPRSVINSVWLRDRDAAYLPYLSLDWETHIVLRLLLSVSLLFVFTMFFRFCIWVEKRYLFSYDLCSVYLFSHDLCSCFTWLVTSDIPTQFYLTCAQCVLRDMCSDVCLFNLSIFMSEGRFGLYLWEGQNHTGRVCTFEMAGITMFWCDRMYYINHIECCLEHLFIALPIWETFRKFAVLYSLVCDGSKACTEVSVRVWHWF